MVITGRNLTKRTGKTVRPKEKISGETSNSPNIIFKFTKYFSAIIFKFTKYNLCDYFQIPQILSRSIFELNLLKVSSKLPAQLCLRLPNQVLGQAQRDQQEVGPGEEP